MFIFLFCYCLCPRERLPSLPAKWTMNKLQLMDTKAHLQLEKRSHREQETNSKDHEHTQGAYTWARSWNTVLRKGSESTVCDLTLSSRKSIWVFTPLPLMVLLTLCFCFVLLQSLTQASGRSLHQARAPHSVINKSSKLQRKKKLK